jgi:gliding-associated putative ABC transporter substrate-binding component GldG
MVNLDQKRTEHLLLFLIGITAIVILNQLSSLHFFRLDLTEEKRFTISDATIEMLEDLDEDVFIEVYLDGALPAGFKRLQKSITESLQEFEIYAGGKLSYKFTDPSIANGEQARNEYYTSLGKRGIQPTRLFDNKNGEKTEKIIFPGAVVSVGGKETAVMLLNGNRSQGSQETLNQSAENIEYELANAIRRITNKATKKIAILQGHQEIDTFHISALKQQLNNYYQTNFVDLKRRSSLQGFDAIILAQPKEKFSEEDIYKIDQFIMRGGKAVFLIDMLHVNMDSASGDGTIALPVETGLEPLLFKYGLRLNNNYLLDLNSGVYPVVVGNMGDQPQIQLMPWPFFPILNNYSDHVIVKNTDATISRFISTIDTVKATGIIKTPLIYSSENTRVMEAPVLVSLNDLRADLNPEYFNRGLMAVSWLLEGSFFSLYKNRILPDGADKNSFIQNGVPSKIIVFADGDFVKNDFNPETGQPVELGFDPFTRRTFANGDLMINAMNYLLDENGIISAKNKEIKIRPLDSVKLTEDKTYWQVVNLAGPIVLVIIFGVLKSIIRKKKFARF